MYKRIILLIMLIFFFSNNFSYGDEFNYLPTNEKVEYLLKNIYGNLKENNRLVSLEYFKKLIITIYHEKKESIGDGKRILGDLLHEIYSLAKEVKNGSILSLKKIRELAIDINDSLEISYNYKATYFKQKGFFRKYRLFKRYSREARLNSITWAGKISRKSGEKEIVETFSELGKNSIKGLGKGFKAIGNGIGHIIGIDRLKKEKEGRKRVKEPGLWD